MKFIQKVINFYRLLFVDSPPKGHSIGVLKNYAMAFHDDRKALPTMPISNSTHNIMQQVDRQDRFTDTSSAGPSNPPFKVSWEWKKT